MKIVKSSDLKFQPASHEDPKKPGVLKKILLVKDDLVDGRVQMINWAKLKKGDSFKNHYHQDMSEIFILLSGKSKMVVDQKEVVVKKGDCVVVPIRSKHKMYNLTDKDVEYIVVGVSTDKNGKTIIVEK